MNRDRRSRFNIFKSLDLPANTIDRYEKSNAKLTKYHVTTLTIAKYNVVFLSRCHFSNEQVQADIFRIIRSYNCYKIEFKNLDVPVSCISVLLTNYQPNLLALVLSTCLLTDRHIEALTWGAVCTTVQALDLSSNPSIGLLGVQQICNSFTGLIDLNLEHNHLDNETCLYLINNLPSGIQYLHLSNNSVGQDGLDLLCTKMQNMNMISLNLSNVDLTNLTLLAPFLSHGSSMRHLDVSLNKLTSPMPFCDALAMNASLINFNVSHTGLRERELMFLLKNNYILTHPKLICAQFAGARTLPSFRSDVYNHFCKKSGFRVDVILALCSAKTTRFIPSAIRKLDINLIRMLASFIPDPYYYYN